MGSKDKSITSGFASTFHFKVTFLALDVKNEKEEFMDMSFSEVSGLKTSLVTEDVRSAGENRYVYHLPKPSKPDNLVLKRALSKAPSELVAWAEKAIYKFEFDLYDVLVELLDEEHNTIKLWSFSEAYPVKLSYSDLNAGKGDLMIETLELAYKYANLKTSQQ